MTTVDTRVPRWHGGIVPDLNATSAALLGLLFERPATGGQLVAASGARFGPFFSVTRSQVYRELPALADQGLLRLGKVGARSSQEYVITPAGKKAFRKWLSAASGQDHLRSTLLLRVVNAHNLTDRQRAELIRAARERYAVELDEARAMAKSADQPPAKAVAQYAQAQAKAALKLIDAFADD